MPAIAAPATNFAAATDPTLNEPSGESVPAGGSIAVAGSYADSFAQSNPGAMYLHISDASGTLSAHDAAGNQVGGSGSNSIVVQASYAEVNTVLQSLSYTAAPSAGSDTIRFDVWNQAGQETTGSVPVSVGSTGTTEQWTGTVSSDWNNPANWSGGAVPVSGDTVLIFGNTPNNATLSDAVLSGETITLQGSGNSAPTVVFNNVTLDSLLQSGNAGTAQLGGTLTIGTQGTVLADANAGLTLAGTAETIVNQGLIRADAGGFLLIYNGPSTASTTATLINQGSVVASGGNVDLVSTSPAPSGGPQWMVQNAGGVDITQGGGVMLNGTLNGGNVAFNGSGVLSLTQPQALTGGATVSGFGAGDAVDLFGVARGTVTAVNNGTLEVGNSGSLLEAIPLAGDYGLGNFEDGLAFGTGNAFTLAYAGSGQPSDRLGMNILAPATDSVTQGGTLALNDIAIQFGSGGTIGNSTTVTLSIDAGSGTLYLSGASGSGTSHLNLGPITAAQANSELAGLTYVPASGATADTVSVDVAPPAPIATLRTIAVTVSPGGSGLQEPSSETVAAGGTVAVSGSYTDSFAAGNPGAMYLHVSDTSGALGATDAAGQAVAGSGSNSITLTTGYADVNAVLHSLTYTAPGMAGSDTIRFDLWNQAGQETTGSVAVTVGNSGGGGGGPTLNEPSSETVSPGGTVAVGGSYSDSFAQGNPGQLYLSIQDSSGNLQSTDASGATVTGSGSNSIALSTDYVDLNAILANLHYAASGSAGADTIQFQVWNQAGVESTGATAVTIGSPTTQLAATFAATSPAAGFTAVPAAGGGTVLPDGVAAGSSSLLLNPAGTQRPNLELALHS